MTSKCFFSLILWPTLFLSDLCFASTCNDLLSHTANGVTEPLSLQNLDIYRLASSQGLDTLEGVIELPTAPIGFKSLHSLPGTPDVLLSVDGLLPGFLGPSALEYLKPQTVVITLPYGYKLEAELERARPLLGFLGPLSKPQLVNLRFLERDFISDDVSPRKINVGSYMDPNNSRLVEERAQSQLIFSNTANDAETDDTYLQVLEAQKYLVKTFMQTLSEQSPLTLEHLSRMHSLVGVFKSEIRRFSDSDIPGDYIASFGLGNEDTVALAGVYRGVEEGEVNTPSVMRGEGNNPLLVFTSPENVHSEMQVLIEYINSLNSSSSIHQVAYAYKTFLAIHPFVDGNGRLGRALLDYMLIKSGFGPPREFDRSIAWVHWMTVGELAKNLANKLN